ncbi:MAG: ATP synthase F0 subunit B [Nitrospinota bacterium]
MIEINGSFLIQLINFLVLIFIMDRLLFKPILAVIDERNRKVSCLKEETQGFIKKAESLETDFKNKLSEVRKESMEAMDSTRKNALKEAGVITGEAKESFEKTVSSARSEIAGEAERASEVLKKDATLIAKQLVSKVLGREVA